MADTRYSARGGKIRDTYKGIRVSPEVYWLLRREAERQGVSLLAMAEASIIAFIEAPIDE